MKCANCNNEFTIDAQDFAFYERIKVPVPSLCAECKMLRRLQFRNERSLYKNKCGLCGNSIITMYHPELPHTLYCRSCFESDKWDPLSYGIDIDLNKPFFVQFKELSIKVPKEATFIDGNNINSDYTNMAGYNTNCYLIFNAGNNENCAYSRGLRLCKEAFDTYFATNAETCYEGLNVIKSYGVRYCQNVIGCVDSCFLLNCSNCQNCFACINLRAKNYYFFNESLSKEEYEKRVNEIMGSYEKIEEMKKKFHDFSLKFPHRSNNNLKSVGSKGDYITLSKNCINCYETSECEDCKNSLFIKIAKDCYDLVGFGHNSELLFDCVGVGHSYNAHFSWGSDLLRDVEYGIALTKCENCFGCDGLKDKQYCILNKQYSKEDYFKLRDQIIEQMKKDRLYGLYFPPALSPFAYNETIAQEYFPLSKEEVINRGYKWRDLTDRDIKIDITAAQIPDHIRDTDDSIVGKVIECKHKGECNEQCTTAFKIIAQELDFYKRMNVPVPRLCPNCRHYQRIKQRNPYKLWNRKCDKCKANIQTSYTPDSKEIVYCEECYKKEVV